MTFFHGVHWTGHIFNTYDQIGEQLEWITKTIDGKQVLAFLPAWDGRYYVNYPEHEPDERMGGKVGLKNLIKKAHNLDVKVVLMFGGPNLSNFKFLDENNMSDAGLKKNLAEIPSRVEGTNTVEFLILLGVIFFLPAGSILCIAAIYFKFRNYKF